MWKGHFSAQSSCIVFCDMVLYLLSYLKDSSDYSIPTVTEFRSFSNNVISSAPMQS